jgi:hypothetical protein
MGQGCRFHLSRDRFCSGVGLLYSDLALAVRAVCIRTSSHCRRVHACHCRSRTGIYGRRASGTKCRPIRQLTRARRAFHPEFPIWPPGWRIVRFSCRGHTNSPPSRLGETTARLAHRHSQRQPSPDKSLIRQVDHFRVRGDLTIPTGCR